MADPSNCDIPAKRPRKLLFNLDANDVFDCDALFEESGSEYSPGSELDDELEHLNDNVSLTTLTIRLCWLPCYE